MAVACGLPDEEERLAILSALARPLGLPLASLRRLAAIAAATAGYSGAELRAVLNAAQLAAAREAGAAAGAAQAATPRAAAPLSASTAADRATAASAARLLAAVSPGWCDAAAVWREELRRGAGGGGAADVGTGPPPIEVRHLDEALRSCQDSRSSGSASAPSSSSFGSAPGAGGGDAVRQPRCRVMHA